jgi:hypothetical protein
MASERLHREIKRAPDVVAVFHSVALLRYDPVTTAELIVA